MTTSGHAKTTASKKTPSSPKSISHLAKRDDLLTTGMILNVDQEIMGDNILANDALKGGRIEIKIVVTGVTDHGHHNPKAPGHFHGISYENLQDYLTEAANILISKRAEKFRKRIEALAEIYADDTPVPKYLAREAAMIARARATVLSSTQWLSASELSQYAGFKSTNPSAQPTKWKAEKKLFSIKKDGADLYPIYAIDIQNNYRPAKGLQAIIQEFGERKDGWALAYWFVGSNSFLGGSKPQDLLKTDPKRVLEAARDEIAGVIHG